MAPAKDRERPTVPPLLDAAAGWCWRILVIAAAVTLLGLLARKLELIVVPLLTALLLTALLEPVAIRLRGWRIPRGAAAVLTTLLAVGGLGGLGVFVVNRATAGYPLLVDQIARLVRSAQRWLSEGPLHLQQNTSGSLAGRVVALLHSRQDAVASGVLSAGRTLIDVVTSLVLIFFLTIFLLYDGPRIWGWLTGLFPTSGQARTDAVGERMWQTVCGYVRGTFLVALFHGVVMGVTLAIVQVPLVAPLAVLVFVGGFIPLIGAVIFGGLAVLVTLVTNGPTAAIIVLVVLIVENQVESHLLQPFVVGRHVQLHPLAITLTLATGAVVGGLPGAIFGVPLVAALNAAAGALRSPPATEPGLDPQ